MAVEDSVAQDQLKAFIFRIERMEEEKAAIAADIKEIYAEAKGNGFDTKILRKIVTIRKQDANERMEQEALLELYMDALGMQQAHEDAMDRALRRGSAGHSAPLFAGRVEFISEPLPTKAAGQAGGATAPNSDSSVENEAAEISTPITEQQVAPQPASDLTVPPSPQGQVASIQESPRKAAEAEGESPHTQDGGAFSAVKGANARLENAVGVEPSPSNPIQPETANDYEPAAAVDTAGDFLREPVATVQGQNIREGDAPHETDRASGDASGPDAEFAGSSNGRTAAFDAVNAGSTPAPAPNSRAERIKALRPMCQSPEACRSSGGKNHCHSCAKAADQSLVSA